MRLFEAIVDANHRALAGDNTAGLRPDDFADALPLVALTCIDPRLNPLIPEVLGVPEDKFIWLRNAGNIITSTTSSTMRSLALACAIKGGREIAILGHSDCLVGKTTVMQLTERLKAMGIERARLPENITEFFGLFGSERQNVLKAVEFVRASALIGPNVPVHGLLVDIRSGKLEWLANGYETLGRTPAAMPGLSQGLQTMDSLMQMAPFQIGEMKFPDTKIGEMAAQVEQTAGRIGNFADQIGNLIPGQTKVEQVAHKVEQVAAKVGQAAAHVEDWIDRRKHQQAPSKPAPPPPPPKPPPAKAAQPRPPALKPIPMPPPMNTPRPPRGRDDE